LHQGQGWDRDATVVNLGFGGACVEIAEAVAAGDRVTLSFVAPNLWDPLLVSGKVAWVKPGQGLVPTTCGVTFDLVHPTTLWALFEMLGALDYDA
jgi:Tfp pilus assembly protein PilZ